MKAAARQRQRDLHEVCKSFDKTIRAIWGSGWNQLGDNLRRAIIAERVLTFFAGQMPGTTFTSDDVVEYLVALKTFYGIDTDVNADDGR